MNKEKCNWHNPDKEGKYSCARFESPDGKETIDMYFNGAQITLPMELGGTEAVQMNYPINFCPVCGEPFRTQYYYDYHMQSVHWNVIL